MDLPPASGAQAAPGPVGHDGDQPAVVAQVPGDADPETGVAPAGERRGPRQVAAYVAPQKEKIGDAQDAGGAAGDAAVDPGLDVGRSGLQVAGLDDAPGEADAQRAGDAAQDAVRRADAAAVPDQQERRAPGAARGPRAPQRAGPT